ncbi:MAG TPA: hypothetical protein PLT94_05540 [Rhodocyclaceae bacterium]|nr:hypothetical protein [Rhodocyclaceae bacterium]HMZ83219.1 hypothetical protein [Rhodocyclaceae bacterium]HNA02824.1 hypothetical protein [Rhodocyclaceae bacterium]HNB77968.1 hypothetical protein [Rhodocyclaceae bacterium]
MKVVRGLIAGLMVGLLASGCQFLPVKPVPESNGSPAPPQPAPPPTPADTAHESQEVVELLVYFQRIAALPQDELRKEYNAVNAAFQREKADPQRLRLALLLLVPGASFRDDGKLTALLEGIASRPVTGDANSPQRLLAQTLLKVTNERLRQLREEQKRIEALPREDAKRAEEANAQARKLEAQLNDEKRRGDELQKKLDALLSIERDLRNRNPQRRPN